MYKNHHALGIEIINYIKRHKGKTVCLQHGGTQFDYIRGQSTSESKYQIIFGEYIYNKLLSNKEIDKNNVFLTGNPLHDDIFIQKKKYLNKFSFKHLGNRKIITLITCLHTEYEYRDDPKQCYVDYINKIYSSIDFKKYYLVVNMHPNDSFNPNIYENQLVKLKINKSNVSIIKPNEFNCTIYDYMNISDLIISRSSTIIEEGLLLQKKIIAFDLFEDGPSKYYKHLEVYNTYKRIIGVETNLAEVIDKSFNEVISSSVNQKTIEQDFTFRFDGNSTKRIINAFIEIKEQELTDLN
jgi:UDP-N-acetylglucosamine 2-epimerase